MKFDIAKVRRVMTEAAWMDLDAASQYVNQEAPEWRYTAVAEAIVCGSTDPVRTAEEYNEIAGDKAMEYASGKGEVVIMKIITHQSPDWDAIGSAWLVQRYLLPDAGIICADRETIEQCMSDRGCAIVDCGGQYAPPLFHFDHHHLPGSDANATCATQQVFEWVARTQPVTYLAPIIDLIWAGDTGRNSHGADVSREVGLHALLAARKAAGWTDNLLMEWGCQELDLLAGRLKRQAEAAVELAEKLVWQSDDGKVVAIEHGEPRHSQAAFAAGATLVVFRSDIPVADGVTHAIGVQRSQAAEFPHIGDVLAESEIDFATEDDNWFRHPAGFFAGRGTAKGPRFDPVPEELSVKHVARAIDAAWKR